MTLNVFKLGYTKGFFYNIHHFFRTIKWAWQRATKGYCDWDRWDLDYFYKKLFTNSLKEFANKTQSAPDDYFDERNDSLEPWKEHVNKMAQCFELSIEESWTNPYEEAYMKILKNPDLEKTKTGQMTRNKYWEYERKLYQVMEDKFQEGIKMLEKDHKDLWD